jgi:hypothetical protein
MIFIFILTTMILGVVSGILITLFTASKYWVTILQIALFRNKIKPIDLSSKYSSTGHDVCMFRYNNLRIFVTIDESEKVNYYDKEITFYTAYGDKSEHLYVNSPVQSLAYRIFYSRFRHIYKMKFDTHYKRNHFINELKDI